MRKTSPLSVMMALTLLSGVMSTPASAQNQPATPPAAPAPATTATGNTTDWKDGAWGHLAAYIGTYNYDAVLNDPAVSKKLETVLGAQKQQLVNNLKVNSPIGFERDCLVMNGNAEKSGVAQRAYLNVCLYTGTINAVIFSKGDVSVYSAAKKYEYLPQSLREWIYDTKNPDAFSTRPDYVQIISQP